MPDAKPHHRDTEDTEKKKWDHRIKRLNGTQINTDKKGPKVARA
jgi:hypothetical protein